MRTIVLLLILMVVGGAASCAASAAYTVTIDLDSPKTIVLPINSNETIYIPPTWTLRREWQFSNTSYIPNWVLLVRTLPTGLMGAKILIINKIRFPADATHAVYNKSTEIKFIKGDIHGKY